MREVKDCERRRGKLRWWEGRDVYRIGEGKEEEGMERVYNGEG